MLVHPDLSIRKTFPTVAGALAWRQETQVALRRGTLRAPTATTLAEAAEVWLAGAETGIIHTRSGDPYKPSALRSYRHALQSKLLPELGRLHLSAIRRNDLQDLVDRMVAAGRSPSTVRNTILPLRAIYRHAIDRDQLAVTGAGLVSPGPQAESPVGERRTQRAVGQ